MEAHPSLAQTNLQVSKHWLVQVAILKMAQATLQLFCCSLQKVDLGEFGLLPRLASQGLAQPVDILCL
jgi:hypothetical protein